MPYGGGEAEETSRTIQTLNLIALLESVVTVDEGYFRIDYGDST